MKDQDATTPVEQIALDEYHYRILIYATHTCGAQPHEAVPQLTYLASLGLISQHPNTQKWHATPRGHAVYQNGGEGK